MYSHFMCEVAGDVGGMGGMGSMGGTGEMSSGNVSPHSSRSVDACMGDMGGVDDMTGLTGGGCGMTT